MKTYEIFEECITQSVIDLLDAGEALKVGKYEFEALPGDVDGVVIGRYKDEDVIVFVQAKNDMKTQRNRAVSQLHYIKKYWESLCQNENLDESEQMDYEALCVTDNSDRKVMFAYGGIIFTKDCKRKIEEQMRSSTPTFYLRPETGGKFVIF